VQRRHLRLISVGDVYGDSTPFPFGANFIETIRHAVDCGVQLLQAQGAIDEALHHTGTVDQLTKTEKARLAELSDAILLTVGAFSASASERVVRAGANVLDHAREVLDAELASLEGHATGEMSSSRAAIEAARESAFRAVEAFVLRYDLPNTDTGLRLIAGEGPYAGEALVTTPFGVEAAFELMIPAAHEWGRPRRVADLSPGTEVHVPKESGWISKRIERHLVKLDRLFLSEVALSEERSLLWLRKGPRSGIGYQIEVSTEGRPKALLHHLSEEGTTKGEEPLALSGEDGVHVIRLWNRVVDSTRDLASRRQAMRAASLDGKSLRELDAPREILDRMVMVLAPIVQEIGRRSGAPGELVLRRDAGEGRRDEVYITKAELEERVMQAPEGMRGAFDSFELSGPRSPRAPSHSEPILLEDIEMIEN
jgi:hypothetical protein